MTNLSYLTNIVCFILSMVLMFIVKDGLFTSVRQVYSVGAAPHAGCGHTVCTGLVPFALCTKRLHARCIFVSFRLLYEYIYLKTDFYVKAIKKNL